MNPVAVELYRRLVPYGGTMMNETEAVALYEAAERVGHFVLIEIGSYQGLSTSMIAAGMRHPNQVLFAIDPHEGKGDTSVAETWKDGTIQEMLKTLQVAGAQDRVAILPATSADAYHRYKSLWGYEAGLVFIDGSHRAQDVLADLKMYSELVVVGGYLILDDLGHSEVMKGYAEWREFRAAKVAASMHQWVPAFEPVDLREWGIEDPIHNRLHEGATGKTTFFRRIA